MRHLLSLESRLSFRLICAMASILATGKGNADWNYSAPHGAGRMLSRSKAKAQISLESYQAAMKDVWTTSVS
ncbi:RtcB family protein, partial [Dactylosporangium cerinum]